MLDQLHGMLWLIKHILTPSQLMIKGKQHPFVVLVCTDITFLLEDASLWGYDTVVG
jgi:hypothetical protein